ncbi:bifunctional adenosylcobinamide kinase/adenosylcobinamide-phosphate guanylyltransferase [Polynucleobacter sp. IMCC30063]|uniref:bifunctional adenosylcobinamide kinase/adenosylcobinamide-phosphate guanylyltransferase n=1 Tax=Polynucleobacter sp. IMCC30063 TaxID=2907298 RepID=UPI001F2F737C|nr:bifunctional adenosylcobinamide kinase/adenosylcobinamide-phosphate guanylyltransferase [Polynucleobacter sp. IMCC30063]MCE7506781.1 bifunctional adenosylcobinamide kinase/adenosylcobinamide-phosphate guanylyltransferase [Polynucleobacter sp. IMCC30063]
MTTSTMTIARSELILGGQKSGKSSRAEQLAAEWSISDPQHEVMMIATAQAGDAEMKVRIELHRLLRQKKLPRCQTIEETIEIAKVIEQYSDPKRFLLIDCLTLWLSNYLSPPPEQNNASPSDLAASFLQAHSALLNAIHACRGPIVLVSNEIGQGVIPLGAETRYFVDQLGLLNQVVAQACERVTLMVAGCPIYIKGTA